LSPENAIPMGFKFGRQVKKLDADDNLGELRGGTVTSERDLDVFGTANFFNAKALIAVLDHMLAVGICHIAAHDQTIVGCLVEGLTGIRFGIVSVSEAGPLRSTLGLSMPPAGIDVVLRAGALRFAPHLYNTEVDINAALDALRTV